MSGHLLATNGYANGSVNGSANSIFSPFLVCEGVTLCTLNPSSSYASPSPACGFRVETLS